MRDASAAAIAYINANNVAFRADLLSIVVASGTTHKWTTWNTNLTVENHNRGDTLTFVAPTTPTAAPIVEVGQESEDEGLSVCTLDLTLRGQQYKIGGKTLPVLASEGYFDGALVTLDHLVMATAGNTSLKSFIDFVGRVDEPQIGVNEVTLRCKSWIAELEGIQLPRRTLQPSCQWRLFDPLTCGLVEASNTTTGTVTAGTSTTAFTADTVAHNHEVYVADLKISFTAAKVVTRGWWDLGTITFDGNVTSALAGKKYDVLSSDGSGNMALASPAAATPAAGDTFSITSGCHLDFPSCNRYSNAARFGGFRHVPPNSQAPVR